MRMGTLANELPAALEGADRILVLSKPELDWNAQSTLSSLGERLSVHDSIDDMLPLLSREPRTPHHRPAHVKRQFRSPASPADRHAETRKRNRAVMNKTRLLRKTHRWMGLLIGIQLLFWILGGLYFSIIPIENIRGEHLVTRHAPDFSALPPSMITASEATATAADQLPGLNIDDIRLTPVLDHWYFRISGSQADVDQIIMIHAVSGETRSTNRAGKGRTDSPHTAERTISKFAAAN